ncbi:sarcosine oxidase subunit alpha family protein [Mongoliimonas terrestris]|uniref:sarcosine oxidase subunit alpha family protein n=1 Tax=Mongoliimonas terrestris TaxID=1709001 RepID=UPI000949A40B|nr:sarcosine oxidase subunit alpha family protein [Mongoliimonas terrestris]
MTGHRLPAGGLVDRARPIPFRFDGRPLTGLAGDTLASALLANGVSVVGRSFKYHRPRGLLGAGQEEPNALMEIGTGARREPNVKATTVELHAGLEAASQNRWPSLRFDLMAVNGLMKPVFAAGFYYKTFMWPARFWETVYEPLIRRAAGLGRASGLPDPDRDAHATLHCDLLVVGAGPAGLMAALAAGRAGARVVLAEEDVRLGGRLLAEKVSLDDADGPAFAATVAAELAALPTVTVLTRTGVSSVHDGGLWLALERHAGPDGGPATAGPRHTLWTIVARRAVAAAGAVERPLVFAGNDRPGVMLAGAVSTYLHRHAVAAGRRAVVATATDAGWVLARDLLAAGVSVAAVVDTRQAAPTGFEAVAAATRVVTGAALAGTRGRPALTGVDVVADSRTIRLDADLLAVSGGFNPSIQLMSHLGDRPAYDPALGAYRMAGPVAGIRAAGAANGAYDLAACLRDGAAAAQAALADLGLTAALPDLPATDPTPVGAAAAYWTPKAPGKASAAFVDLQHDVTAADVTLAHQEGYRSAEHLKRYTTLGMATDQGRTATVDGLAIMAALTGRSLAETGAPIARPPVVPLPIGALAGPRRGAAFRPVRLTPVHGFAEERKAVFLDSGAWKRPQWYPLPGETDWLTTVNREVAAVRAGVGVTDVSTLGKIEIEGPDAGAFLDKVYANRPSRIPVGRSRYGLMLREDGFVLDDGTVTRFSETRFLASVSTAHAAAVYRHMLFCRQVLWPSLDVSVVAVSDAWAQLAIAGPLSPAVVAALLDDGRPITAETFPPMAAAELTVLGGVKARLAAVSFSGERAFELAVPASVGDRLIRQVMAVGAPHGIVAYGTEAMGVMRVEKGHPAAAELNGQTTAHDLGLHRLLARDKDHVGRVLSARPGLTDPGRPRLVGLKPVDPAARLRAGAHVIPAGASATAANDQGWISSAVWSPTLGHAIALAFVTHGPDRMGETVRAWDGIRGTDIPVVIVPPAFVDPEGARVRV